MRCGGFPSLLSFDEVLWGWRVSQETQREGLRGEGMCAADNPYPTRYAPMDEGFHVPAHMALPHARRAPGRPLCWPAKLGLSLRAVGGLPLLSGRRRRLPWWRWSSGAIVSARHYTRRLPHQCLDRGTAAGGGRYGPWGTPWGSLVGRRVPHARSPVSSRTDRLGSVAGLVGAALLSTLVSAAVGVTSGWLGSVIATDVYDKRGGLGGSGT